MAKIYNVLRYVDDIKPNRFTDDTKVQWLNEVEGYIQTEVMMLALADVVQYDPEAHMHTELLVKSPHDKLYALYLCAMIDFANGEYDKYANTMQLYNEFLGEYIGWYTLHFRPADGGCVREGYYLSAYAIAVVKGFEGTEEEWIKSLEGKPGMDAYEIAKQYGYAGTREEFGQDQAGFAENAAQVRIDREAADQAAAEAETSAGAAHTDAERADQAAVEAEASAGAAHTDAERAEEYHEGAVLARDVAVDAANAALAAQQSVDRMLDRVEEYSAKVENTAANIEQTVHDTLREAKNSGEFDGEDGDTPHIGTNGNWWIGDTDTGVKAGGTVTSVNGVLPDESGNVEIELSEGGTGGGTGIPGADGFSPSASVEQTDTGAVITITDKYGTTTATITNGKDGQPGEKGEPGMRGEKGDPYTLTETDKSTIVDAVLAELPTWNGGSY